jgi:hypothetical protein
MNKMTKEDIEYRQGRSKKQVEGTYKILGISLIGLIGCFLYILLQNA